MAEPGPAAADSLVERSLRDLRWRYPYRIIDRLSAGASSSHVFLLDLDHERAVLKVTEDPDWLRRAGREFAVYDQLAEPLGPALPTVLAAHRDRRAVRLLLSAHQPLPPARQLDQSAWVAVADQLGRLHGTPAPAAAWLESRPWPSAEETDAGVRRWSARGSAVPAARAAAQLARSKDAQLSGGPVLTHGDCHVGNLLLGRPGHVVWIDWQEVCLSNGLDDLVFLWQRAEFDGASPPRDAMTAAYAAARRLRLDDDFRSAMTACELRLLLVAWPPFLAHGQQDRQELMTQRLVQLSSGDDP